MVRPFSGLDNDILPGIEMQRHQLPESGSLLRCNHQLHTPAQLGQTFNQYPNVFFVKRPKLKAR